MASPGSASVKDIRGLRSALERQSRDVELASTADVVIDATRRLLLRSPNGTYFALVVSDAGVISTVNMGANPL
jgi:hypothetical protein